MRGLNSFVLTYHHCRRPLRCPGRCWVANLLRVHKDKGQEEGGDGGSELSHTAALRQRPPKFIAIRETIYNGCLPRLSDTALTQAGCADNPTVVPALRAFSVAMPTGVQLKIAELRHQLHNFNARPCLRS